MKFAWDTKPEARRLVQPRGRNDVAWKRRAGSWILMVMGFRSCRRSPRNCPALEFVGTSGWRALRVQLRWYSWLKKKNSLFFWRLKWLG